MLFRSGSDLYTHRSHLKNTPMLMLDAVLNKLCSSVVVFLISGIRDPGAVRDYLLCFRCDPDKPSRVRQLAGGMSH